MCVNLGAYAAVQPCTLCKSDDPAVGIGPREGRVAIPPDALRHGLFFTKLWLCLFFFLLISFSEHTVVSYGVPVKRVIRR